MEAADSISINSLLFVQVLIERGDIYLIRKFKTCYFIVMLVLFQRATFLGYAITRIK